MDYTWKHDCCEKGIIMLGGSRSFTGRNEGGYFVGLLEILHLSKAFWSSAICALVRAGLL